MSDKPRFGRPVGVNEERLLEPIEEDPRRDTRELAEELQCHLNTVAVHLRSIGKTWKYGAWIPHDLSGRQLQVRRDACMNLLTFRRTFAWLEFLVTGDEKWVLCVNHTRKRQWLGSGERGIATPKTELHTQKVMLSVWWNCRGIIHSELLPTNYTVTVDVYCRQLDCVAAAIRGKQEEGFTSYTTTLVHTSRKRPSKSCRA
ncbi:hypothetical protein Y032_0133g1797 [Ancylostoma ceylanicum]|uniref:Uncharacterized protein n=1 Tax=Ancylostoma ceylanicum TaxID=53326 RepID=A0A016T5J8_9BILA|nr:hypothetical protein Y032_0133g1797 [Ancylostoma ceylanicum]